MGRARAGTPVRPLIATQQLLSRIVFVLVPTRYDDPEIAALVAAVQEEYVRRYGGQDAAVIEPDQFAAPTGLFLLGRLDGEPVAMGGWRRLDGGAAEIKRMYVVDRARRRGLARAVLTELERTATDRGVARLVLNTGTEQPEAIALYESSGYTPTRGFGHYADAPKARFYEKELSDSAGARPG